MNKNELNNRIDELEREIAILPQGNISKKIVKNKEYFYYRVCKDGKRRETYVPFNELKDLEKKISKRKELMNELQSHLKSNNLKRGNYNNKENELSFKTMVRIGSRLKSQVELVKKYKKRECISKLRDYIFGEANDKVFIVYGLRRTGKTTMIRQIISELSDEKFSKAAFIQVTSQNTLAELDEDIRLLEGKGYKYLFIDEVTLLEDFIEGSALFADIYASSGIKIVLSGTDSLGFAFSKDDNLYDRSITLHTTFIPYREFENVLGMKGIDEYIRYGGTMSLSGINYNEDSTFASANNTEDYIDTAIAKNIQHSLKLYENGGHFRSLLDLYERNELTNVINRVIESMNHSFTKSVVEKVFKSNDISITANNLLRDSKNPMNIKKYIDEENVNKGIMKMLDIINKEEQSIDIEESHLLQIKEYLEILDLVIDIDLEYLPDVKRKDKLNVISQSGLRYAQAETIANNLLQDEKFRELNVNERNYILERLLNEIKGRMMEEIVLLETKISNPDKKVFKLQFPIGEFDMVVYDSKNLNCEIYEIKHSDKQNDKQFIHLIDEEKCKEVMHQYGDIKNKYVIYRGEDKEVNGIKYLNVEKYLKNLK